MSTPTEPRTARAMAILTFMMLALGSCGTVGGAVGMQIDPVLPAAQATEAEPTEDEALELANRRVAEALLRSAHRKPLAGVNLVVSVLLLVAAFSLMRRRETAIWWATQACLANGLLALVETASQAHQLWTRWGEIIAGLPMEITSAAGMAAVQALGLALVVRLATYGFVAYRVRRPDIRAMLARGPD